MFLYVMWNAVKNKNVKRLFINHNKCHFYLFVMENLSIIINILFFIQFNKQINIFLIFLKLFVYDFFFTERF